MWKAAVLAALFLCGIALADQVPQEALRKNLAQVAETAKEFIQCMVPLEHQVLLFGWQLGKSFEGTAVLIAREIALGLERKGADYEIELDRKRAIKLALAAAGHGDIVLIAGKGHERFQITSQGRKPHSDIEFLLSRGLVRLAQGA